MRWLSIVCVVYDLGRSSWCGARPGGRVRRPEASDSENRQDPKGGLVKEPVVSHNYQCQCIITQTRHGACMCVQTQPVFAGVADAVGARVRRTLSIMNANLCKILILAAIVIIRSNVNNNNDMINNITKGPVEGTRHMLGARKRRQRPAWRSPAAPQLQYLIKTKLPGNVREVWVPKGKLLAGPIATLLKQDTSIFPLGTITHALPGIVDSMNIGQEIDKRALASM